MPLRKLSSGEIVEVLNVHHDQWTVLTKERDMRIVPSDAVQIMNQQELILAQKNLRQQKVVSFREYRKYRNELRK